ncbi:hypothetical protein [Cobetia marina]|uniref:hypothetical protein n=1 Tax=Cobetia marina TaxID=28258 RepID=UPI001C2FD73D
MKTIIIAALYLLLAGCTTAMHNTSTQSNINDVDFKNYTVGQTQKAYVGDQIIARKSYQEIVRKNQYQALNDFVFKGGLGTVAIHLNGSYGDIFRIAGQNENGNKVVHIPHSHLMFGIDSDGKWDGTVMARSFWNSPVGSGSQYSIEPSDTTFRLVESRVPHSEAGYLNHEIIFTGLGANGLSILYREYTFEDMARTAYKQELIYPRNSRKIRFKNYDIEIISANASEIVYKVISD